jgi:cytochrome P450
MAFATTHFARHPELQRELRENPDLHEGAVNEIVRRFGISNLGRIAREDLELGGVAIRKGDQVLGIFPLAGLDERVNPDPMTFDPRRRNARHMDFGNGPHTCLGARLALREIHVFLKEWMAKMPQFRIVPGTAPRMSSGIINTMRDLQLQWD